MKIIQSFWSGGKDILRESFGWHSPQHHLMAWALSCQNIRNFYGNVELYTDNQGYEILINQLHLSYSKVHVILDELKPYPKELWALAKIKAYSQQNEPFIHIDGDVFIYSKFDECIHKAALIAQNSEKATEYYQSKFSNVINRMPYLPGFMDIEFNNMPVCSCNAGIIGGNDIGFLKKYSSEVFDFVDKNIFAANPLPSHLLINFNILFEQIFFYNLTRKEGKEITCLFDNVFEDNGYKYDDFGDFATVPFLHSYLHFIGPIKRDKRACDLMSRVLLRDYPEHFFKIASLFEKSTSRYCMQNLKIKNLHGLELKYLKNQFPEDIFTKEETVFKAPELTMQRSILEYLKPDADHFESILIKASKYEESLIEVLKEFNKLSPEYLLARDINSVKHFDFFYQQREIQLKRILQQDPLVKIIETVFDWTVFHKKEPLDKPDIRYKEDTTVFIACVPEFFSPYYQEIALEDIDCFIFSILESSTSFETLLEQLKECFNREDIENNYENFFQLIMLKVKNLINNKCITIADDLNQGI